MPIFEWNEGYAVGVAEIDRHHLHLVGLLNDMYDGFEQGVVSYDFGSVLDRLIDYATYHFSCEEGWMAASRYPGLAAHQEEHRRFVGRVVEMQKDLTAREAKIYLETMIFLKNWLADHILKRDAEYGRFAAGAGTTIRLE